ncbi:MAG: hypothetical protein Q9177_006219 [Variospora cf. flavescens]
MLNKLALAALAACIALLPHVLAEMSKKPPMGFCKEGTCSDDENGCPAQLTTSGPEYPKCVVYNTEDVLGVGDFRAAEGGGTEAFLDIQEPDPGCAFIVRSPASVETPGCGVAVGMFRNPTCAKIAFKQTFMVQHCCGSRNCESAGAGSKMIRGMNYKARGLAGRGVEILGKDGNVIPPKEQGYPLQSKRSLPPALSKRSEEDDKSCKKYVPDGEIYTRPADGPQIVMTGVDGGTEGAEVEISEERTVTKSVTFSAGINIEIIEASTEMTFEESITNSKSKKLAIPAGQVGKLAFTPNLKCTEGALMCEGGESKGEACTGYEEAGEIAGTYSVITTS